MRATYETMDAEQKSRWMAMLLAVDEIDKFCQDKHVDFENLELKPIAIKHFINATSPKLLNEIKKDNMQRATNKVKSIISYACDV